MVPVILLVDDEPDLLMLMSAVMRRSMPDYDVRAAASLQQAEGVLAEIESSSTELALVLVDHVLGGRTGLEILDTVDARFPGVPTLMLTGQAPPNVAQAATELGAKVLYKPLPLSNLVGCVQEALAS